ncbi:hypothetical protein ACIHAX_35715 [Nocardia sp. NPDC051929]|uniref:hypothetical protein n=1 Tax=Nocardia sp. NPDC051929 TaxID=3364327 RepID=UPI0037CB9F42
MVEALPVPTVADRVIQASLKLVLEPILEADFLPCSSGFRLNRRAWGAVAEPLGRAPSANAFFIQIRRVSKWTSTNGAKRYADIHGLLAKGQTIRGIGIRLGPARGTVRRIARAESPEELLVNNRTGYRTSLLDEFKPYLHQRWNQGCTNAARLFEEIRSRGYRGRASMVRACLQRFRTTAHIPPPPPKPPTVRKVTAWIITHPANIDPSDQRQLDAILKTSPALESLAAHVRAFATIMTERRGRELEQWMTSVDADNHPASW